MLKKLLALLGITSQPARPIVPPSVSSESKEIGRSAAVPAAKPVMPAIDDGSEAWRRYDQEYDAYLYDLTPGEPDTPDEGFGLKMHWLAIRSEDSEKILACLPSEHELRRINWDKGLGYAYRHRSNIFVSPPVQGWTFIVGWGIPEFSDVRRAAFDNFTAPFLQTFADVQYYGSYRVVDYVAWGRAEGGTWQRLFAYCPNTDLLYSEGAQTDTEQALGLIDIRSLDELLASSEEDHDHWLESLDEEIPLRLAGKWSIDPDTLPSIPAESALGWLVTFPSVEE